MKPSKLGLVSVVKLCPCCQRSDTAYLTPRQFKLYVQYKTGKLNKNIQEIFPELNASTREKLKTGICQDCWEELTNE